MTLLSRSAAMMWLALLACAAFALALSPARAEASFGLEGVGGSLAQPDGQPLTQAGAHADFTTNIKLKTRTLGPGERAPDGNVKDIEATLPPGLLGDPQAFDRCTQGQLKGATGYTPECPVDSQVGIAEIENCISGTCTPTQVALYNMSPPGDIPGQFAFNLVSVLVFINVKLRHDSSAGGGGYVVTTNTEGISQTLALSNIKIILWGVPADPAHDAQRFFTSGELLGSTGAPGSAHVVPLMRNPTSCGQLSVGVSAVSWGEPELSGMGSFDEDEGSSTPLQTLGCERLPFAPSISVTTSSTQASHPTGLEVALSVPQNENPYGLASADLRDAVVKLPAGMVVNPSSADGLGACGPAEIGLSAEGAPSCPASSKIGEVKIQTPLLPAPLEGAIYLARQGENPFGSTLAVYLVASGSGVIVKLAGEIAPDPNTGQLTARFTDTPQLPFSTMILRFKGGERAALSNPSTCGTKTVGTELTSWAGSVASPSASFEVTGSCAAQGFAPTLGAGSTSTAAGGLTGFTLALSRNDGEQTLGAVSVTMPPGLLGYIKSVPLCQEPAAAEGACGEGSLIGHTTVAAGAGSNPFYLSGKVYLTGPYAGAPYGLAVVVPAVAGPLNLGTVVVRAAISVDRQDGHLTVSTGALPSILDGIPLQLRLLDVTVDRPGFLFNPTSCRKLPVSAGVSSSEGASATVTSPFQLSQCAALSFKPKLTALTEARTSKAGGAYLHVRVVSGAGQANLAEVKVDLPKQLPSRLVTLQKACTQSVFEANPASCPAASVVGMGSARTPIFNGPLSGPAYIVSHGGAALPDVEVVLQGEGVTLVLDGTTKIKNGITSSDFKTIPDAPITSFDLVLPEGPHSALTAYGKLCGKPLEMPTALTGQNGAKINVQTTITVSGCPRTRVAKKKRGSKK